MSFTASVSLEEHLAAFTDRSGGPSACWVWKGRKVRGYAKVDWVGKTQSASRLALANKLGRAIKSGLMACHACDNPSCVNPDHLFEGTSRENHEDMVRKGRANYFGRGPAIQGSAGRGRLTSFAGAGRGREDDWADINGFDAAELGVK